MISTDGGVTSAVTSPAGITQSLSSQSTAAPSASPTTTKSQITTVTNWVPSAIIADTETGTLLTAETGAVGTQTSGLPRAITPAATAVPGTDYGVVTIGFKEELNYPFVVKHSLTSAQIFQYLPLVLTYSFTNQAIYANVTVKSLVPYTAAGINYVITVAEVYFPYEAISSLQSFVLSTYSKLYNNPDPTSNKLALLIENRSLLLVFRQGLRAQVQ